MFNNATKKILKRLNSIKNKEKKYFDIITKYIKNEKEILNTPCFYSVFFGLKEKELNNSSYTKNHLDIIRSFNIYNIIEQEKAWLNLLETDQQESKIGSILHTSKNIIPIILPNEILEDSKELTRDIIINRIVKTIEIMNLSFITFYYTDFSDLFDNHIQFKNILKSEIKKLNKNITILIYIQK